MLIEIILNSQIPIFRGLLGVNLADLFLSKKHAYKTGSTKFMLNYKMRRLNEKITKKSIRHRKAPTFSEEYEEYSISFANLLDRLELTPEEYYHVLLKLLLSSNHKQVLSSLTKGEETFFKHTMYTLTTYGFRFDELEYFTLYTVQASRLGKYVKTTNKNIHLNREKEKIFEQKKEGQVISTTNLKNLNPPLLQRNIAISFSKDLIKDNLDIAKTEAQYTSYLEELMAQKLVMFSYTDQSKLMTPIRLQEAYDMELFDRKK